MEKAQYAIMRFAKYKGPEIGNIEAHNERTKEKLSLIHIFTGTPIDETIAVFGDVVDSYTMKESSDDGITVRIAY